MTQHVSDIIALAHTIGMAGFQATKDDQPASNNANTCRADAPGAGQKESHFALATRLGLPGFEPATGGGQ